MVFYWEMERVPSNIKDELKVVGLAYWFMDNGSRIHSYAKGFRLCTDAYDRSEVERLQEVLEEKFRLSTTIFKQRNKFTIGFKSESHDLLISLIKDFVIPEFRDNLFK